MCDEQVGKQCWVTGKDTEEVTTIWRYTNVYIIVIIIIFE